MTNLNKYISVLIAGFIMTGCAERQMQPSYEFKQEVQKVHTPTIDKNVGITGAAGELKRLTFGGYEELVSKLSNDGKWLLMDTYNLNGNNRSKTIIQKLSLETGVKMILTPSNSTNNRAIWDTDDKSIIFTSKRSGSAIVQSMGVDGESGIKFITNSSLGTASEPDLNNQGTDIVFVLNNQISMIKPNGTQVRMFGNGYLPKFSPNDDKILFSKDIGERTHIFTMKTNGTQLMQLTAENASDFEGSWSPNGEQIAFISNRANNHNHLFIMNSNGSNIIQLTDGNFDISSVHWGKDGNIYFSANAGGNRDLWKLKPMK